MPLVILNFNTFKDNSFDAVAVNSPAFPATNELQSLFIAMPPGFSFKAKTAIKTTVVVADAYGQDKEYQEITVMVGL
jgi:hypothetical protein